MSGQDEAAREARTADPDAGSASELRSTCAAVDRVQVTPSAAESSMCELVSPDRRWAVSGRREAATRHGRPFGRSADPCELAATSMLLQRLAATRPRCLPSSTPSFGRSPIRPVIVWTA
jgi:hypothetical protein